MNKNVRLMILYGGSNKYQKYRSGRRQRWAEWTQIEEVKHQKNLIKVKRLLMIYLKN